ncbi:MAG: PrsW family intramembrane metalloprotease [Phycisphaeraceae bacterium]|nr:PrsW family intramembrane metalloprotease [Phycisphaeraceae bacterium]
MGPACWKCGYSLRGLKRRAGATLICPECGAGEFDSGAEGAEAADQTVWDEPGLSPSLAGQAPEGAVTYASWLRARMQETAASATWWLTLCLAVAAGPWSIVGTFAAQFMGAAEGGLSLFGLVLVAPLIEEVMKIAAVTWAVERRPYWFRSPGQLLICCVASGVVFAAIENVLYLEVYIADPSSAIVWWRWTVCVALHSGCSLIAGLGLRRIWTRCVSRLERPEMSLGLPFLTVAIVVHAVYNALAMVLGLAGLVR